ncbi:hypothetical protein B0O99DRAFT_261087 [Bisporella sp. PMI_857]|nr:hypothetical protein B0O99DRAFT_261087 [Bisporella sp. PMI_857]
MPLLTTRRESLGYPHFMRLIVCMRRRHLRLSAHSLSDHENLPSMLRQGGDGGEMQQCLYYCATSQLHEPSIRSAVPSDPFWRLLPQMCVVYCFGCPSSGWQKAWAKKPSNKLTPGSIPELTYLFVSLPSKHFLNIPPSSASSHALPPSHRQALLQLHGRISARTMNTAYPGPTTYMTKCPPSLHV